MPGKQKNKSNIAFHAIHGTQYGSHFQAPKNGPKLQRKIARNGYPNVFVPIVEHGHEGDFEPQRMPLPTMAPAGSKQKVEVLEQRVVRGEQLFHPDDADGERITFDPELWDISVSRSGRNHG